MKKRRMAMCAAAMMLCGAAAIADEDSTITAHAGVTIPVKPEYMIIQTTANAKDETAGLAQQIIDAKIDTTLQALQGLGVTQEDIRTTGYSYYRSYDYDMETGENIVNGYEAMHSLEVTCRDPEKLDTVIALLMESGMDNIFQISYEVNDPQVIYNRALAQAVAKAEEKARVLADAAGMELTGIESIRENETASAPGYDGVLRAASEAASTQIRNGMVEITADVTVVYETRKR